MFSNQAIILLVGPKGCGKSHIGTEIGRAFPVYFLRIEKIWQEMKAEFSDFASEAYIEEGIKRSLATIHESLQKHNVIIIESTGAFEQFASYICSLKLMAKVYFIKIQTPLDECFYRVHNRENLLQVQVSDDFVNRVNTKAETLNLRWDLVINNNPFVSTDQLKAIFSDFIKNTL